MKLKKFLITKQPQEQPAPELEEPEIVKEDGLTPAQKEWKKEFEKSVRERRELDELMRTTCMCGHLYRDHISTYYKRPCEFISVTVGDKGNRCPCHDFVRDTSIPIVPK